MQQTGKSVLKGHLSHEGAFLLWIPKGLPCSIVRVHGTFIVRTPALYKQLMGFSGVC